MFALILFVNIILSIHFPAVLDLPYIGDVVPIIITFALFALVYGGGMNRFRIWIDDSLGDQADHLRARHLGKRDWSQAGRWRRKIGLLS